MKRLKRENAELKRANAILKSASAFFAAELDRPQRLIVEFIREHATTGEDGGLRWGVEPICAVLSEHGLQIAPSTYYEHVGQAADRRGSAGMRSCQPRSAACTPTTTASTGPGRCG